MIYLEKDNLDQLIKTGKYLVDFYADWCAPCNAMMPILDEIDDKINIIKIDIEKFQSLTLKHRVMSIPTFMFFVDGVKKQELVGLISKEELEEIINNL